MGDLSRIDRYAPLSEEEQASAAAAPTADQAIDIIMPVPAEAPAPSFRHPRHGEPAVTWTYRGVDGAVLFHVCRFNKPDGTKEFAPRSWVRLPTGKCEWL